jgi:hypothetical protein
MLQNLFSRKEHGSKKMVKILTKVALFGWYCTDFSFEP